MICRLKKQCRKEVALAESLTMAQVAALTGLHKNTIRKYVKLGDLKATMEDHGVGKQRWTIAKDQLYACGIPEITRHLDPQEVKEVSESKGERIASEQMQSIHEQYKEISNLKLELKKKENMIQEIMNSLDWKKRREQIRDMDQQIDDLKFALEKALSFLNRKAFKELHEDDIKAYWDKKSEEMRFVIRGNEID